jgi:hypothetical protein
MKGFVECEQLIVLIKQAERFYISEFPRGAPPLTVAARVYSQILPEPSVSDSDQWVELVRLVVMIQLLRDGCDPRCATCATEKEWEKVSKYVGETIQ